MARKYAYRVRNQTGRVINGLIEADGEAAAVALLRQRKYYIVEVKSAPALKFNPAKTLGFKIKLKDLAIFCRQFATMQEAGIPIIRCLSTLVQQTGNKNFKKMLMDVINEIESGKSLSESFKNHAGVLPDIFISMIAAGEASGTIDQALGRLAENFGKEYELREKIKSAMTYPILIGIVAFISMVVLMIFVVPVFTDIFTQMGATLPLPTRILIGASHFISKFWYLALFFAAVLLFALRQSVKTKRGKEVADRLFLRLPVIGPLTHKTMVSRFTRTLSTLLKSGVPFLESFDTVKKVVNNTLAEKEIINLENNVQKGEEIAPLLLKSKIFPPMVVSMISIGEESGMLDDLLEKIALFYDQEIEAMVARMSSLIEPLMILGVGLMIGFIALSIYLPLFGMSGAMQGGGGMP